MRTGAIGRLPSAERVMIAQRQNVQSRVKCCGQKGLTWPGADAYDWLFD